MTLHGLNSFENMMSHVTLLSAEGNTHATNHSENRTSVDTNHFENMSKSMNPINISRSDATTTSDVSHQ